MKAYNSILAGMLSLIIFPAFASAASVTYFSCAIKEKFKNKNHDISVKFAIQDFDPSEDKGELVPYPGVDEDEGYILVTPKEVEDRYSKMANLNGQGGDLRLEDGDVRLWGDGDGYQYTDLVIWDVDQAQYDEETSAEGYVRDYGPAYWSDGGRLPSFKQFITCNFSKEVL